MGLHRLICLLLVLFLQIEEARLQTDFKLLSTILWSAAVFELFTEPVYKRLTQLLFSYRHLSHDAESVRRVQEVRPRLGNTFLRGQGATCKHQNIIHAECRLLDLRLYPQADNTVHKLLVP